MTKTSRQVKIEVKTNKLETKAKVKVETLNCWKQRAILENINIDALDKKLQKIYSDPTALDFDSYEIEYDDKQRLFLYMKICNQSSQEIAGELGLAVSSVRSEISRGISKAIRYLSQELEDTNLHIKEKQNITNHRLKEIITNLGYKANEKSVDEKQRILDVIANSEYSEEVKQKMIKSIEKIDRDNCQ